MRCLFMSSCIINIILKQNYALSLEVQLHHILKQNYMLSLELEVQLHHSCYPSYTCPDKTILVEEA